jgi:REP element-mobilizing transposase RayT
MARPVRVELEGAVYHVTARGNERRATFRDDKERDLFLATLVEMVERFSVRVHAYYSMPNHYSRVTRIAMLAGIFAHVKITRV